MVVFDSAPASLHPSVAAQQSIFAALRDSKLEALQSAMLISYHTAPVISVVFLHAHTWFLYIYLRR